MFPLFLPSRLSRKVFTRFKGLGFSSSSSSPPEVSVWWHLDSRPVPSGFSFSKVAPSITAAVRANGIMGTIHIRAYGDVDKEAFNSTNITLHSFSDDYPFGIHKRYNVTKNNTYKHFLMDLNDWVSTNPPPLHLFLIIGKEEFSSSGILHRLRMSNYNILLACPGRAHVAALCHAATIMWEWSSMLKGDDLTGKHFNYPPDGPTNSWYENLNVPLENPFSVVELHTSSQNSEEIYKPTFDIKLSQALKSFSRQVLKILCSHPNGISIGDLRAELTKCDMPLIKHFYGNKKFSNFLISISYVQLQYLGGGNFWVRLVPSTTSAVKNNQKDGAATQKPHNDGKNMERTADGVPKISSSRVSSEGDDLKSFQSIPSQGKPLGEYVDGKSSFPLFMDSIVHQPPNELQKKSLEVDVARAPLPQIQLLPNDNNISKKSDNDVVKSDDGNPEFLEKINPSQNPSTSNDCTILKNKHEIPTRKEVDEVCRSPFTSTFCSWISSWWTFWKSNAKSKIDQSAPKSSELQQDLSHPLQPHWDNFKFRVAVWWDFDSCGVPSGISFLNVAPSIMGVLRANGIKGPIHIDAYGDVSQLSQIKQEALFLSGIDLHHIPGGKNKNKCLVDWFSQNPSPIHRFLISGDKDIDFSCILLQNFWRRDDIFFLACPGKAVGYVSTVAFIKWRWSSVLKGKYLTGKYFCYPPDWYTKARVPLEYPPEWYINWKVCLENPFSSAEESTSSQNAEIHIPSSCIKFFGAAEESTSSQNADIHIPSSCIKFFGDNLTTCNRQIKEVLSSYPNGISIGELKIRMCIPGKTKLFIEAITSISQVQLLYIGDDNFCVRLIPSTSTVKKKKQRDADHSEMRVLFSTDSLGDDVENFVFSSRGSRLISRSRSREDLAHRLQRHGPMFFMSLTENEILQLVELLITKLKWLKESPSEAFPFILTESVRSTFTKELLIDGTWRKILENRYSKKK